MKISMDTDKKLNKNENDTSRKLHDLGSLNHSPIVEDNVEGDAFIDDPIGV